MRAAKAEKALNRIVLGTLVVMVLGAVAAIAIYYAVATNDTPLIGKTSSGN